MAEEEIVAPNTESSDSLYETFLDFSTPEKTAVTLQHFDSIGGAPPDFETKINFQLADAIADFTIVHVNKLVEDQKISPQEAEKIEEDVERLKEGLDGIAKANSILNPELSLIRMIRRNTARATLFFLKSTKEFLLNRDFSRDVGRFWRREIAQPLWLIDTSTGKEELEQTVLDPDLNREFGSYALTCEWERSKDKLSITDAEPGNVIGLLLFEQLTDLVVTRRKFRQPIQRSAVDANHMETRVPVCLPKRETYFIVLWKGSKFQKISIPESYLNESGKPTFLLMIRTALLQEQGWQIVKPEKLKSAVDTAFTGNATMQEREGGRMQPDRFDVADLSLVLSASEHLDVAEVQADPRGTFGINIPKVLHVGISQSGQVSSIGAKSSHPYTDGAPTQSSLTNTLAKIAEPDNLEALKKRNKYPLVGFSLKTERETGGLTLPETLSRFPQEHEQTPVHFELQLDQNQLTLLKKIADHYKNREPKIDVSIHAIFHMALMAYFYIDKAHYLEADKSESNGKKRNDLVPALSVFPNELIAKFREGADLSLEEQKRFLACLEFLQDQRDQVRKGWGTARVSAVIVGRIRDLMIALGEYIDPAGTSLTSKIRLMTSMLVSRKTMSLPHAISTSGFMTAINSNYTDAVAGVTEKGSDAFEFSFRARKNAGIQLHTLNKEDFAKITSRIITELAKISDQAK